MFYEPSPPGSAEEGMFFGAPGVRLLSTIGAGPIRGAHTANASGWVVSAGSLYSVNAAGAGTLIGPVGGSGRVCIVNNDVQLVVMHSAGWSVYTYASGVLVDVPGAPTTA